MKNLKVVVLMAFLSLFMLGNAQKKKVAVITFYADKTIDLSALNASADLIAKNTNLSDDPNFNLTEPLKKLHAAFFSEYAENFDFEFISEKEVLSNAMYKEFKPTYEEGKAIISDIETTTTIEGYNVIPPFRQNVKDLKAVAEDLGVDGIMFINLSFGFVKTGVGSFGYVSIQARYSMDLYTKDNNSIFQFNEVAGSPKKAVMLKGIPVMSPDKIQPMCESAVDKLMKDLNKKVKRLAKKANKKM
ncbi:hypothetical protein [Winogradskyella sp. UBA3174]|uniref:hypothetical protein n=1 Tax=Winogradskyella sp. UBA3174 TaxID=1947785 RepID=UPI0025D2C2FD|nr:hypothetical protein [Winogradskyella sp. UBA3174]|tara:strand:- start:4285 stop:5019 length:735 start_codon:yes stop_codon:yes gene_type:complete